LKNRIPGIFKNRIFQHVIFWLAHLVFYGTLYGSFEDKYRQTFTEELIYLPGKLVFTYFTLYFLLPRFLLTGRYGIFILGFLASSLVVGLWQRYIAYTVHYPMYYQQGLGDPFFHVGKIIKMIVGVYPITFAAVMLKLLKYWYTNQKAQLVLKEEKLQAELKFLKTQIHPHFLFNTLNNLYALTLKKSERAPDMVLKLSELIDYMLYECSGDAVSLEKEIKFIQNYIDIEKMRYGEKLDVDLQVIGDIHDRAIAPLIILPFVENCFKHGASESLIQSWVKIRIEVHPDTIIVKVENSKAENGQGRKEGIGIQNVTRRLDLLFPGRYTLKVVNEAATFLVILTVHDTASLREKINSAA
jgi:two-component system, LytTR family, sensor kinase